MVCGQEAKSSRVEYVCVSVPACLHVCLQWQGNVLAAGPLAHTLARTGDADHWWKTGVTQKVFFLSFLFYFFCVSCTITVTRYEFVSAAVVVGGFSLPFN